MKKVKATTETIENRVLFLRPGAKVKSPEEKEIAANGGNLITDSVEPAPANPVPMETIAPNAKVHAKHVAEKQDEEVQKLSERIKELEKQLRNEPQSIEERIIYYKKKQELTERYEHFQKQIAHLSELREKVAEKNGTTEDFGTATEIYRLQLFVPHAYRSEAALSITNESLIDDVLDLLQTRMMAKAEELKAEISA